MLHFLLVLSLEDKRALSPLTCFKSFVTMSEQSKYSHLPTLEFYKHDRRQTAAFHPRKEKMEIQPPQETRPRPRASRQRSGTHNDVWTNRQRAEEEERGMGKKRADKGRNTQSAGQTKGLWLGTGRQSRGRDSCTSAGGHVSEPSRLPMSLKALQECGRGPWGCCGSSLRLSSSCGSLPQSSPRLPSGLP